MNFFGTHKGTILTRTIIINMRKFIFILLGIFIHLVSFAQNSIRISNDSILREISESVQKIKFNQEKYGRFKMYQTDNIYILIKLDTATGIIKLVQWSLDSDKEFETYVNSEDLSGGLLSEKGRFELYPTKNMFQLILLDTLIGSTWHVQWGTQKGEYWIRKISLF